MYVYNVICQYRKLVQFTFNFTLKVLNEGLQHVVNIWVNRTSTGGNLERAHAAKQTSNVCVHVPVCVCVFVYDSCVHCAFKSFMGNEIADTLGYS